MVKKVYNVEYSEIGHNDIETLLEDMKYFIKQNNSYGVSFRTEKKIIKDGCAEYLENKMEEILSVEIIEDEFTLFSLSNLEVDLTVDIDIINKIILNGEGREIVFEIRGDED